MTTPYGPDDYVYDEPDDHLVLNFYGQPIIHPGRFEGLHKAFVPASAGLPPRCSCGWTRFEREGVWVELCEHLDDMGEFATRENDTSGSED